MFIMFLPTRMQFSATYVAVCFFNLPHVFPTRCAIQFKLACLCPVSIVFWILLICPACVFWLICVYVTVILYMLTLRVSRYHCPHYHSHLPFFPTVFSDPSIVYPSCFSEIGKCTGSSQWHMFSWVFVQVSAEASTSKETTLRSHSKIRLLTQHRPKATFIQFSAL